jgi:hypothetical protein
MNLQGIDLRRRAVLGVEFRRCELAFADFTGADLSFVRFVDCNLYRADFTDTVLYTTWFHECNLTRAEFKRSYLLGLRFRNVDLTKTSFDATPAVGLERKVRDGLAPGILRVDLLDRLPRNAPELEEEYSGIRMRRDDRTVAFLRAGDSAARRRIRLAETAKYLKLAYAGNGYERQAQHYHVVERRQRRKAMHGSLGARLRRIQDFVLGDLIWRYGTSAVRPALSLAMIALLASAITFAAPALDSSTGLRPEQGRGSYAFQGWNDRSLYDYLNVLYFFLTAPAGGSQDDLHGWVKIVFAGYLLTALWLIALTFEASTRRLGNAS